MPNIRIPIYAIDFEPPLVGLEGYFNTFRIGGTWAARVKRGSTVLLYDTKEKRIFGRARVTDVELGKLLDMAGVHAHMNHNQLGKAPSDATADLMRRVQKRYGPRIAHDDKRTTVIYLQRTK
jgi:hypothetical protein